MYGTQPPKPWVSKSHFRTSFVEYETYTALFYPRNSILPTILKSQNRYPSSTVICLRTIIKSSFHPQATTINDAIIPKYSILWSKLPAMSAIASTQCVTELPPEILGSIFSYLSNDKLLDLPKRLLYNGLSIGEASKRYRFLHLRLPYDRPQFSRPSSFRFLEERAYRPALANQLDNHTKHPIPASAAQELIMLGTQQSPLPNNNQFTHLVHDFCLQKHKEQFHDVHNINFMTVYHIHRLNGIQSWKDWKDCKICADVYNPRTVQCLIHALRAQATLKDIGFSPEKLSKHVKRMKNLKLIRVESRQPCYSPRTDRMEWTAGETHLITQDDHRLAREVLCETFGISQESPIRFELKFTAWDDTYPFTGVAGAPVIGMGGARWGVPGGKSSKPY